MRSRMKDDRDDHYRVQKLIAVNDACGCRSQVIAVTERSLSYRSPIAINPGTDGILDALEKLSDQASAHGHLETTNHAK
jgi:hypothetical protein